MRIINSRYEEIKSIVADLLENLQIATIPIDPFQILEKLKIRIISYQSLSEEKLKKCLEISEDGFSLQIEVKENGKIIFVWQIYYNAEKPKGRIKWTLSHELGHIYLNHTNPSELAESEANFFAKYLLAPPSVVDLIKPSDYLDIA